MSPLPADRQPFRIRWLLILDPLMAAQEWKFESPYPLAARLLIISSVTHAGGVCAWVRVSVCECSDCLCQGDRVRVLGDRESGAATPQEKKKERLVVTLCLSFAEAEVPRSLCGIFAMSPPAVRRANASKQLAANESYLRNTKGGLGGGERLTLSRTPTPPKRPITVSGAI